MTTQQKIENLYVIYSLCKCRIRELVNYTKICKQTILKYLAIQENLDIRLFPYLDNKNKKLTLDMAFNLVKTFPNPDTQYDIFINELKKSNKENKLIISNLKTCNICCDDSIYITCLHCCNNFICERCLVNTILISLKDISFKISCCPFCNEVFTLLFLEELLSLRFKNKLLWIDLNFKKFINYEKNYFSNLFNKYRSIYENIRKEKALLNIHIPSIQLLPIILSKEIYGCCSICTPKINQGLNWNLNNIKIKSIEKRCINDQNQLLIVKPEMFTCSGCETIVNVIKKCPHCGIGMIKPENCNFIERCECRQSWCFICSSRLPGDNKGNFGHGHHYWMGSGTSAYDPRCRVTENSKLDTYVIKKCKCRYCIKRNGKPVCLEKYCNESAINWKCKYCWLHRKARYQKLGRGIPSLGEPELNIHNINIDIES